jgi:hypothetical protein
VRVLQNWPKLEKRPPFLQFSSKLSEIFLGERSDKLGSFFKRSKLLGAYFFAWMTSFSAPYGLFVISSANWQVLKMPDINQLSPKRNLRSFDES